VYIFVFVYGLLDQTPKHNCLRRSRFSASVCQSVYPIENLRHLSWHSPACAVAVFLKVFSLLDPLVKLSSPKLLDSSAHSSAHSGLFSINLIYYIRSVIGIPPFADQGMVLVSSFRKPSALAARPSLKCNIVTHTFEMYEQKKLKKKPISLWRHGAFDLTPERKPISRRYRHKRMRTCVVLSSANASCSFRTRRGRTGIVCKRLSFGHLTRVSFRDLPHAHGRPARQRYYIRIRNIETRTCATPLPYAYYV